MPNPDPVSVQDALVTAMVTMCVADRDMATVELRSIELLIERLPVFAGFDKSRLPGIADRIAGLLQEENGLDTILSGIRATLPERLHETVYALAVEVAAADVEATQEELRFLEMMRHDLEVTALSAAAIEHGARVRYRKG